MTTTINPTREHHDVVDVLERLAAGPMRDRLGVMSERMTLLVLDVAFERAQQMKMSELGVRLGMSRAAMTTLVDRLEAAGWVARWTTTNDRRVTHVEITQAGRELVAEAMTFDPDAERFAC